MLDRIAHREFGTRTAWSVWALRTVFVAFLLLGWLGPWSAPTSMLWTAGNVGVAVAVSLWAALAPAARPEWVKRAEAAVYVILLLNLAGGAAFALYRRVPPYDLGFHFVAGSLVVYVLYALSEGIPAPALWRWGTPVQTAVFAFAASLAVGALWEIFEGVVTFLVPNTRPIHHYFGTVKDLIADAGGALVGALVAGWAAGRRSATKPPAGARPRAASPD